MSRRVVLDASAALEAALLRPHSGPILDLLENAALVSAPDLFAAEVATALWKHQRAGDLDSDAAQTALEICLDMVDSLLPASELAPEALATSIAHDHPVYDALYAVTARRTGAKVCTLDRRLTRLLEAMAVPTAMPEL